MKGHKDLEVWKRSIKLAKEIYRLTESLPKEELYGLSDQMKRAVVSIASNIAEGAARNSQKEFIQFLYIALGSASELDTQIEICKEIRFKNLNEKTLDNLQNELAIISKMIYGLISNLKTKIID
ncbi:23S rRNA-associated protein [Candidatus Desulfofervidus auxilii]|uniref:23S rRNA-associated protein n=1 Tax=Desulfofervidus auxilii TaxID=1621989 RepID=A0A7U4QIV9_DESA2|nr:four helix bundle protein [Candidatus Desulfofervidus auxilii]AMM40177.1 23S rRNA-associated protein [Candidatus Desulfofervidus auxilii]CAD7770757.1 23S rRNA-intervening sequence protein [Candidatus Methanoperedenaceae archaeon GB50]CAD7771860.1 23S rRNA-intervening sequence protein [Candidatus Methanoperedenaceae archaeon GB37]